MFLDKISAQPLKVKDKSLRCGICGHAHFFHRKGQRNTRVATMFNVDWAHKSAHCHVCADGGPIEWFLEEQ
jgi:hypothetical protein